RPELAALVRVKTALEQGTEDGRVDVAPILLGSTIDQPDFLLGQRKGAVIVEKATVEPSHLLEADASTGFHSAEQVTGEALELAWVFQCPLQHPREDGVRQELHVLGEHAKDQSVDEVSHVIGLMTTLP